MEKKRIIIVGGGFGGVYTFKNLEKKFCKPNYEILLISEDNFFLFTPMLHEVATGGLDPEFVIEPIREIMKNSNSRFIQGRVTKISTQNKTVYVHDQEFDYDYLIISTGAQTNYFNIAGARENTISIKSVTDAINLKNTIIDCFEKAAQEKDAKKRQDLLSFVVVGGGPTGVEVVVEIYEFIFHSLVRVYQEINIEEIDISLVNSSSELVSYYHPSQREYTKEFLEKLGVRVVLNALVTEVQKGKLIFSDVGELSFGTAVWAAGVKANLPENDIRDFDKSGRILVNSYLQVESEENVYAVGDIAHGYPMLAYTATRQAEHVAQVICDLENSKEPKKFSFSPQAKLMSLGQKNAIGEIMGLKLKGRLVWFLWRTVYLTKIISFRKKVKIALNWTFNLFNPRDITRIP